LFFLSSVYLKMLPYGLLILLTLAKEMETVVFYDGIVNNKARGISNLAGALDKRVTSLEVLNNGTKDTDFYLAIVPSHLLEQFAYISGATELEELVVNEVQVSSKDSNWLKQAKEHRFFKINLGEPLKPKATTRLKVTIGYVNVLKPLPEQIGQKDNQFSLYEGTRYFFSPYTTLRQSVRFVLASSNIKSYTETRPVTVDKAKIKYGPFDTVNPFTSSSVMIHFQNNEPILRATSVVRDYEVSHWGNVRVSENYNMLNAGAKLKGPYESQPRFQMYHGNQEPSAVRSLRANLPPNAHRVSYTDRIGNISTSNFRKGRKRSVLDINFRYPLFGGWKTDFEIAYDAPSSDFLRVSTEDPSLFVLNVSFSSPFKTPVTELMTTKIALPEGAYDVRLELPYEVDSTYMEKRFTYLDSSLFGGRPVQAFTKRNVVDLHTRYFQVYYRYNSNTIALKPIIMCTMFFLFFIVHIFFRRIDLSLERPGRYRKAGRQASYDGNARKGEVRGNGNETKSPKSNRKQRKKRN